MSETSQRRRLTAEEKLRIHEDARSPVFRSGKAATRGEPRFLSPHQWEHERHPQVACSRSSPSSPSPAFPLSRVAFCAPFTPSGSPAHGWKRSEKSPRRALGEG